MLTPALAAICNSGGREPGAASPLPSAAGTGSRGPKTSCGGCHRSPGPTLLGSSRGVPWLLLASSTGDSGWRHPHIPFPKYPSRLRRGGSQPYLPSAQGSPWVQEEQHLLSFTMVKMSEESQLGITLAGILVQSFSAEVARVAFCFSRGHGLLQPSPGKEQTSRAPPAVPGQSGKVGTAPQPARQEQHLPQKRSDLRHSGFSFFPAETPSSQPVGTRLAEEQSAAASECSCTWHERGPPNGETLPKRVPPALVHTSKRVPSLLGSG